MFERHPFVHRTLVNLLQIGPDCQQMEVPVVLAIQILSPDSADLTRSLVRKGDAPLLAEKDNGIVKPLDEKRISMQITIKGTKGQ